MLTNVEVCKKERIILAGMGDAIDDSGVSAGKIDKFEEECQAVEDQRNVANPPSGVVSAPNYEAEVLKGVDGGAPTMAPTYSSES